MKRKMTPAAVNKMIKKLQSEKDYLTSIERSSCVFYEVDGVANEEPPAYDFVQMNGKLDELDCSIASLRHAVNLFNTKTKLKDSELTVDAALVRMAQLNAKKLKLDTMRKRLPKQKKEDRYGSSSHVEYICANYDLEAVKREYAATEDTIADLQMKIDFINQTKLIDVEIR